MLIDGISLVDNSSITNSHIESGTEFPASPSVGRMYYLTSALNGNDIGLYVYNGSVWVTGDITQVVAGTGLTGGGDSGVVTLAVDTTVIATRAYTTSSISAITTSNVAEGTNKYYTDARASAAAPVQTVAGRSGAVVLTSSDVSEGSNLYYTTARAAADAPVQSVAGHTGVVTLSTSDVSEGSNKYYTDARASAAAPVQTVAGRSGVVVLTSADVGLANVDNKSSATIRSEITSSNVTTALGFTPVDASIVGAASGLATLGSDSKILSSQLPAITITDTFVVANEAAMLALTAQTGDVAVRSDLSKTFILKGADATVVGNWQELLSPTAPVQSVAGRTGAITLTSTDVAEGTNLYYTTARAAADAPVQSVAGKTGVVALTTADISENSGFKYYTDVRAAAAAPVQSVAGRTGVVVLTSTDVGLANVENKSSATIRGEITSSNVTTALGFTPVNSTATIAIANGGTGATSAEAAATALGVTRINPTTAKAGDIKIVSGVISLYDGSAWKQVFPAVYA